MNGSARLNQATPGLCQGFQISILVLNYLNKMDQDQLQEEPDFLQRTESRQIEQPPVESIEPPMVKSENPEVSSGNNQVASEEVADPLVETKVVQGNQPVGPNAQNSQNNQMHQSAILHQIAEGLMNQSMIQHRPPEEPQPPEYTGMPEDFYYPTDHDENIPAEGTPPPPIQPDTLKFYDCFGMDSHKRNNLWLLNNSTFVYASAVSYHFYDFKTGESNTQFSRDGGGIGTISVHPSRKFYAVGEKGVWPNVYIYSDKHNLYRVLRKGTERSYSHSTFTKDGSRIATVGSSPDYQICIWDWKQETILLKAKAFSQEVYKVAFSEYNNHQLFTSGMGHIKFWKVAETFTGLKLKGEIAKFGQVELSDVYAGYIFPDGKVLSGTEYGRLILWEGNVIKILIGQSEEEPCHRGAIESIFYYRDMIISGGKDGYLKSWRMAELDQAEGDEHLNYFTKPIKELLLTDGDERAQILQVVTGDLFWLVGDQRGKVWRVDWENVQQELVFKSNSGPQYDLAVSSELNAAVTGGDDGGVRLWDYANNALFYERKFPGQAKCLVWMNFSNLNKGRVVIVGFSNGIVRFLLLKQDKFQLLKALKVHPNPIEKIILSQNTSQIGVLSSKGEVFFLKYSDSDLQEIWPYCLWETKLAVTDICFSQDGTKVLMGSKDGKLYESTIPVQVDNSENYLVEFNPSSYLVRMMESQKPKKEDLDLQVLMRLKDDKMPDVEWEPAPIMNVHYFEDKVLCTAEGKYLGCLYVIDFAKDRPVELIPILKTRTYHLSYSGDLILIGYANGQWDIRHKIDYNKALNKQCHDMDYGRVRKLALNKDRSVALSVSDDGTLYCYQLDYERFQEQLRRIKENEKLDQPQQVFESLDMLHPERIPLGINSTSFTDELLITNPEENDIVDDKIYSIQQAKLLAEEDHKRNEAEKKKETVKARIMQLREQFQQLRAKNQQAEDAAKLTEEELCVDPEFKQMLLDRVAEDVEETRKELEWDRYYSKLKAEKLKAYMIDELEIDKFVVKGFKNGAQVNTFKVKKLSEFLKKQLAETYQLIEEERKNQENQPLQEVTKAAEKQPMQHSQVKISQVEAKKEEIKQEVRQEEGTKIPQAKIEREKLRQEEEEIRKKQEQLEKTKPTKESFEPDHLRVIQEAIETLGDYKLKSSKDFVVPENQRMNVSKKRKHMYMLEEFIYNTKVKFNHQLIALKKRKVDLIDKIKRYNVQIKRINEQLGKTETLFTAEIDRELEDPTSFMEISDEQITEYMNRTVNQQKKEDVKRIAPAQVSKPGDGGVKTRKGIRVQASELEDQMKMIQEMVLNAEKQRMLEEVQEEIIQFDKDVVKCQNEKNVLESDMLIAQMKLVTFHQELIILEEMEDFDNKLIKELLDFKRDKFNLDQQSEKVVEKLAQLQKLEQENEKQLNIQMKEWKDLVYPDDEVKREKIHQYFYRKFKKDKAKRLKKQQEEANSDSDEDKDEDEGEGDDDDYLSEDEDEEKPDPNIENDSRVREVIDKICEIEEQQETYKKEKQENDRLKIQIGNKIQLILKDLKRADDDLRAYQRKKLQRVNQLDVSFVLKLSQVQNLSADFQLPADSSWSILFTEQEFFKLCQSIIKLEQDQKMIEAKKLKKERKKKILEFQIKKKDAKIEDLNKKYEEKHMLKFGDIIDLKILDALEPTKAVLDMRGQFQLEEKEAQRKIARGKEELGKVKQQLLEVKRENTKIFATITDLGRQQMELSKKLTSGNKQLFKGDNKQKRSDLDNDRQNLEDLVKFLNKEIDDLKNEIGVYKKKGGHIYTNLTSTKQNFALRQG